MLFSNKEFTQMPMHWQIVVLLRLWSGGENEDELNNSFEA
jgi:hypothetical protein